MSLGKDAFTRLYDKARKIYKNHTQELIKEAEKYKIEMIFRKLTKVINI